MSIQKLIIHNNFIKESIYNYKYNIYILINLYNLKGRLQDLEMESKENKKLSNISDKLLL